VLQINHLWEISANFMQILQRFL